MDISWESAVLYADCYQDVTALYVSLCSPLLPPRRVVLRNGSIRADASDFISDVQIKAKRFLIRVHCEAFARLLTEQRPMELPEQQQLLLGKVFYEHGMGLTGDYRCLYFRTKNQLDRDREEPTPFPEATEATEVEV
jgi:hypothetical protein